MYCDDIFTCISTSLDKHMLPQPDEVTDYIHGPRGSLCIFLYKSCHHFKPWVSHCGLVWLVFHRMIYLFCVFLYLLCFSCNCAAYMHTYVHIMHTPQCACHNHIHHTYDHIEYLPFSTPLGMSLKKHDLGSMSKRK